MLNALGSGVNPGATGDLLLNPADYNGTMYHAMLGLHDLAVKPVTALVLAIIAVMSLAAASARFDQGDQQLGIRMIAATMFRIAMVLAVTEAAVAILHAIDQIAVFIAGQANQVDVGSTSTGQPLGDALRSKISEADTPKQLVMIILLLLPWLLTLITGILAQVLIFVRFLQMYVMSSFASLPIAFAGMEETKGIAIGFVKRYATVALQGAVLIISIKLYQALMGSWLTSGLKVDPTADVWDVITGNIGDFFVAPFVLAFILFGAMSVSRAIIGEG